MGGCLMKKAESGWWASTWTTVDAPWVAYEGLIVEWEHAMLEKVMPYRLQQEEHLDLDTRTMLRPEG